MIVRAKYDGSQRIDTIPQQYFTSLLIFVAAIVLSLVCVKGTPAQKILIQTGFEDYAAVNKENVFQPDTDTVKTGKKSLGIFFEMQNQFGTFGYKLDTNKPIVSVEFWVYIERGKQSFAVNIHSAEEPYDNKAGGPYIDWYAGDVRHHVHRGDPWREIFDYAVNQWNYVQIVANFEENVFDFYMGESREKALASQPKRSLAFQDPAIAPRPKWFIILAWAMTAPGYIDDLLIYEGEKPINLAVEPAGKLTTLWGQLKRRKQNQFWDPKSRPVITIYTLG